MFLRQRRCRPEDGTAEPGSCTACGCPEFSHRVSPALSCSTCKADLGAAALPDLAGEDHRALGRYADCVHGLHPGEACLNPLEPDLPGEYFIVQTLLAQNDLAPALARAAHSPGQAYRPLTMPATPPKHGDSPDHLHGARRRGGTRGPGPPPVTPHNAVGHRTPTMLRRLSRPIRGQVAASGVLSAGHGHVAGGVRDHQRRR